MAWTVQVIAEAQKELSKIPRDQQEMIRRAFDRMKENPFWGNMLALKGKEWKGVYRRTVGRYRVFFIPLHDTQTVRVVSIRLRTEKTYR